AAAADPPQIYLTWHAPWGYPGATDTLSAGCDTTATDTLWMSADVGKASPTFLAFMGVLLFHPALGDTLSAWWYDDGGKQKPMHLKLEMDPDPGLGYPQPYRTNGGGGGFWARVKDDMRLRMGYATPFDKAVAIERKTYVLARILVNRPPPAADA